MTLTADSPTPDTPPPPSRCAQLIYTSFDDGAGRGGWQVKQVVGDVTAAEQDALVGRVVTRFDLEPRLPDFPTREQIAGRPARLTYARLGGLGAFWHTIAAGPDASGRPGNVFAHIAVDRAGPTVMSYRPIVLWGSADWLRPYGPTEVADTVLTGNDLPAPGPDLSARGTIDFLTDPELDRQGVFRVLLDATAEAIDTGGTVVLLTRCHQDSASWIAAVSHFLPLSMTHRFAWTTHDRPDQAAFDIERGIHLIAMPAGTVHERTTIPGALIIDDAEIPRLADVGASHQISRGEVKASALSAFVEGILEDAEVAQTVLARRDHVVAACCDPGTAPAWPLAVAVAQNPELQEFHDDALKVVSLDAPSTLEVDWANDLVANARARYPLTAADTLEPLVSAAHRGRDTSAAATRFLTALLQDDDFLDRGDVARVPTIPTHPVDLGVLREMITAQIDRLVYSHAADPIRASAMIIRLTVILYRLGRVDADLVGELIRAWAAVTVTVIWTNRPETLDHVRIPPEIRAEVLRPVLAQWPREQLDRIEWQLWRWFFDGGSYPLAVPAHPSAADRRLYPIAVATTLGDKRLTGMAVEYRRAAVTGAVDFTLADHSIDDDDCRRRTDALITLERPAAADLVRWARQAPHRTSPAIVHDHVFHEPRPDMALLSEVAHQDTDDPAQRALTAAARLRAGFSDRAWWPLRATDLLAEIRACLAGSWDRPLADDLSAMLYAGVLLAQSQEQGPAGSQTEVATHRLRAYPPPAPQLIGGLLEEMLRRGQLDISWLAGRSLLSRMDSAPLAPVIVDHVLDIRWPDRLISWAVDDNAYRGPTSVSELRDAAWPTLRWGTAADAQDFFGDYEAKARAWLREFRIESPDASLGRSMIGRFTREDR